MTALPPPAAANSWPVYAEDEIAAAAAVLRSGKVNYWTGGEGRAFETEFAAAGGCPHAVALANGTLALEAALLGLGLGPGDEVIVTPRSFIASVSAIILRGAHPVFADVDPDSQNLTAATVAAALTPRTRAIMAVHLAGWPCEMDGLRELAASHRLKIIEDCAQAHGATYRGRLVGSLGDAAAFSFCQDKIITTGGEGGMLTTADPELYEKIWSYKDHGKSRAAVSRPDHPPGFRWLHESFGSNWRLTEPQSAIGRIQLRKLPDWLARRRANAAQLTQRLADIPGLRLTEPPAHIGHAYYKYYCFVRPERLKSDWSRDRILAELNAAGAPALSGGCPEIYREKAFPEELRPAQRLPVAKQLGETSLMFPVHPTLTEADLDAWGDTLAGILHRACR